MLIEWAFFVCQILKKEKENKYFQNVLLLFIIKRRKYVVHVHTHLCTEYAAEAFKKKSNVKFHA